MKKITLFAVAALAASQAFAAQPVGADQIKAQTSRQSMKAVEATRSAIVTNGVASRADEVVPASLPTYVARETFYIGLSRDWWGYDKAIGFAPAKGTLKFTNLSENKEAAAWSAYSKYFGSQIEEADIESTDIDWVITTSPAMRYEDVTLVTNGTTYCDSVAAYYAGDPAFWGFDKAEEGEDPTPDEVYGVSPNAFRDGRGSLSMTKINKKPSLADRQNYDSNGVYTGWATVADFKELVDVKVTGYGFILPQTGSPYLLSSMYLPIQFVTSEEVTLVANVYAADAEGNPTDKLLGKGTAIIPAGNTEVMEPESGAYMLSINLSAVNEYNLSTGSPIAVYQPVYISLSGVDNDAVTSFNLSIQMGPRGPEADEAWRGQYYKDLYAYHTKVEFSAQDANGEAVELISRIPWVVGFVGAEYDGWWYFPTDYFAFYNITYPYVNNAVIGEEGFDYEAPVEGGDEVFVIDSNLDITQLYDDMLIDDDNDTDWIELKFGTYDSGSHVFSAVQVTAAPLPEGVEGRKATIHFTGYACDFEINVTQGDPNASISSIVANKAAEGKVFDLQGRAVKNATKGIYIVDGVKTILK